MVHSLVLIFFDTLREALHLQATAEASCAK